MPDAEDRELRCEINRLVERQRALQQSAADGEELEQLRVLRRDVDASLDQLWDLLRQRRARRHHGLDPDSAEAHDRVLVSRYRQ